MVNKFSEHLSEQARDGFRALYEMRMMTIKQFQTCTGYSQKYATDFLNAHFKRNHLGRFGGMPLGGQGRAPNVYFLTEKGHDFLQNQQGIKLGDWVSIKPKHKWPASMPHRLKTVDLFLTLRAKLDQSGLAKIHEARFDFRQAEFAGVRRCETTDFLSQPSDENKKIIPDAALIVERADSSKALIFLECDLGTESIGKTRGSGETIESKLETYKQYFRSKCFVARYNAFGQFASFLVLFATTSDRRVQAIRERLGGVEDPFDPLFLFATHADFESDPCGEIFSRKCSSNTALLSFLDL